MEGIVALLLIAILKKVVDFVRQVRAGELNAILTQVVSWVGGALLVMLVAQTSFADSVSFGGVTVASSGFWTQVLIGLALASTASLGNDVLAAVDNSRTSRVAPLIPTEEANTKA